MNATSTIAFLKSELRPRGRWLTPFNLVSVPILLASAAILAWRFAFGLGTVSNVNQEFPWGLWKGLNVITGVAFAGGAYVLTFLVYVLRLEKYHSIVRATVLNGFLLLLLRRRWCWTCRQNILNPIIITPSGSSVLFLVAWHHATRWPRRWSSPGGGWLGSRRLRRFLAT
jgi:hypothetical protein